MRQTRRSVLRGGVAFAGLGLTGVAGASHADRHGTDGVDDLRVVSSVRIPGAGESDNGVAVRDVYVDGTFAYVAVGTGVTVVDFQDPTRPHIVAEVDVPGVGVDDVKVAGDLLAASSQGAADDDDIGTHFYDVSDPTDARYLGTFQVLPAGVHNHFLDGDVAYLCKEYPFGDSALKVVDISDPTNPTLLAEWRVEDVHPDLDRRVNFAHDVHVQDDLAYVAYWDAGTRVLDVSDPAKPVEVNAFGVAPKASEPAPGDLNFTDPTSEFSKRVLGPPGNAHLSRPSADGEHVYVNAETYVPGGAGPMTVWNVSDLDAPDLVATIDPPALDVDPPRTIKTSHNFDLTANRLYTTWYEGGTRVFDITDPGDPTELSAYNREGFTFDTAARAQSYVLATVRQFGVLWLHDDRGDVKPEASGRGDPPRDIVPPSRR